MTWKRQQVAELVAGGGRGLEVIGLIDARHCGCKTHFGMRLDTMEPTLAVDPCDQHGAQVARALDSFKHMPPQDTEVGQLWRELLEAEIGTGV